MENIGAGVNAVLTREKKQEEEGELKKEEVEYILMKNEMIFFLREDPHFQISAVGEWCENARGDVVQGADIYFRHISTGQRCESAWSCLVGMSEPDEHATEKWEALCERIEELENLEVIVCDEKQVGL